jgi:hypothetical protein
MRIKPKSAFEGMRICYSIVAVRLLHVKFSTDSPIKNFFKLHSLIKRQNSLMNRLMFTV